MEPTLRAGEFVLVEDGPAPEGAIAVANLDNRSVIKRVSSVGKNGVWLLSDNADAGTDSRKHGSVNSADVTGRVRLVLNRPLFVEESFR